MSFYKIPQNYAPGFVPQRYTFINDAAAATLTARLTDTRTAESVAELVLRDLWMPEIDVSAFLRRMAATVPFSRGNFSRARERSPAIHGAAETPVAMVKGSSS